jgi:hypothetical protein
MLCGNTRKPDGVWLGSSPNKGYSHPTGDTTVCKDHSFMYLPLTLSLVWNYGNTFHWVGHFENIAVRKIMFIYWTNRRRVGHFTNTWTCKDINFWCMITQFWLYDGTIYTVVVLSLYDLMGSESNCLSASIDILSSLSRHTTSHMINGSKSNYFFDVSMNHLLQFACKLEPWVMPRQSDER